MPQKWKVLLAFTGIFVAGAVAGGVVMLRVEKERAAQAARVGGAAQPKPAAVRTVTVDQYGPQQLERYIRQLGLSPEQSTKISPLIDAATQKLDDLSTKNRAATLTIREDLDKEVSALLTDGQRQKLAEMQKNRRDQYDRMSNRPAGFGPGGLGNNRRGGGSGDRSGQPGPGPGRQNGGGPNGRRASSPAQDNASPSAPAEKQPQ
jgi:Spy/CpxP family protein refolding chaperone